MIIGSWNIRGCNDPLKVKEVKDFFHGNNLDILAVLETRIRIPNIDKSIHQAFVKYRHLLPPLVPM